MTEQTICPGCRLPHTLTRTGLCASCNMARARAGRLDEQTEANIQAVVEAGKNKETPHRVRKTRRVGGRR